MRLHVSVLDKSLVKQIDSRHKCPPQPRPPSMLVLPDQERAPWAAGTIPSTVLTSKDAVNCEVRKSNGARMLTKIKEIPVAPLMQ